MSDEIDEEQGPRMPKFECRLLIPDEISGGDRLLIQQVDIMRQEIFHAFQSTNLGRKAFILAKRNQRDIERFNRIYWMILGAAVLLELILKWK